MYKIGICGAPGAGKCLKIGTKVIMNDLSLKCVEDIKIGDKLLGIDGKPRNVLSISNGIDRLYRIVQNKGDDYYVTKNHILSLVISGKCGGYKKDEIVNITVNDWFNKTDQFKIRAKGYTSKAIEFPNNKLLINPYYLGLWLGDGHANSPERITTADKEVVEYLHTYATELGATCKKVGNSLYTYSISGSVQNPFTYIRKHFKDMNLFNNKHIPNVYKNSSIKQRLALLAGMIDSDGHLRHGYIEFCIKNNVLADDIVFVIRSLGFKCNVSNVRKTCTATGYSNIYKRITISGDLTVIPTKVLRKQCLNKSPNKDFNRTSIDIHVDEISEYYGFELDGDNLFLLEDFTVTHNSTTSAGVFYECKRNGIGAELVQEFIREELNKGFRLHSVADQLRIFMKQREREDIFPFIMQWTFLEVSEKPKMIICCF